MSNFLNDEIIEDNEIIEESSEESISEFPEGTFSETQYNVTDESLSNFRSNVISLMILIIFCICILIGVKLSSLFTSFFRGM